MNIYIVRHGTTVWNQKGISQGHSQNRLSESGKQLVIQTANKHKDTKFDIIFWTADRLKCDGYDLL